MKKILFSFIAFLLFFGSCFSEDLWYTVKDGFIDYFIKDNWVIQVVENYTIDYKESSHWFFRDIPYLYNYDTYRLLKTPIGNVFVKWAEFKKTEEGNFVTLQIGSKDIWVNWETNYAIWYTLEWAIREFSWWQEFYWNIVGTDWDTSFENVNFRIHLPEGKVVEDYYALMWIRDANIDVPLELSWGVIYNTSSIALKAKEWITVSLRFKADSFPVKEKLVIKSLWRHFINYFDTEQKQEVLIYSIYFLCFLILLWVLSVIHRYLWKEEDFYFKHKNNERVGVKDVIYYDPPKGYMPWDCAVMRELKSTTVIFSAMLYHWIGQWLIDVQMSGKRVCFKKKEDIDIDSYQFQVYEKDWKSPEKEYWNFCFWGNKTTYYPTDSLYPIDAEKVKKIADTVYYHIMKKFCPSVPKFLLYKNW
jgi:hypothetical protein